MAKTKPQIETKLIGNSIIINLLTPHLLEDVDIAALEETLLQKVEQVALYKFVLDFEKVEFLSSAVLRVLIKVNNSIMEKNGKLRLCGIDPKIMEVFKITRLNKVFAIDDNARTSLDKLGDGV